MLIHLSKKVQEREDFMSNFCQLAIQGGSKTITKDFPVRGHFGIEEKAAALRLFDKSIASGEAFGYNGEEEENFGKEFAAFLGGGYADGLNSGTNAVFVALRALELPPFSEVVVSAVTDPGGIMPIVMNSCIPVIADCAPGKYNIGVKEVEAALTPLTSAIIVAHIGGEPADIEGILKIAEARHLPVIEDCAQSHGAKINGRMVGTFGTYGAFSLMFGKHFCTGGQGGAVFCKTEDLYWRCRRAADRGKPFNLPEANGNVICSLNCNLDELGAAIGREQLKKLPGIIARRQKFSAMLAETLKSLPSISIPALLPGAEHSYWWWRLKVNHEQITCSKKEYCEALVAEGVKMNISYDAALPFLRDWFQNRPQKHPWNNPLYKGDSARSFPCPNALTIMQECFNLTVFESWGEEEAGLVAKAFQKVDRAFRK